MEIREFAEKKNSEMPVLANFCILRAKSIQKILNYFIFDFRAKLLSQKNVHIDELKHFVKNFFGPTPKKAHRGNFGDF